MLFEVLVRLVGPIASGMLGAFLLAAVILNTFCGFLPIYGHLVDSASVATVPVTLCKCELGTMTWP